LNAKAFSKMKNLRLLKIRNVHLSQGLCNLSNNLRAIDWQGYPLKTLPLTFSPDNLVELHMPYSRIEQIWMGKKVRSSLMHVCCFFTFQIKLMSA
jgi:hypothetical protein